MSRTQIKQADARFQTMALARWDDDGGARQVPKRERMWPSHQEYWLSALVINAEEEDC